MVKTDAATKAVGAGLISVLPNDGLPWYRKPHVVKLHLCVLSLILFGMFGTIARVKPDNTPSLHRSPLTQTTHSIRQWM